jgi:DNA-binding PadR family transcriptional regulator
VLRVTVDLLGKRAARRRSNPIGRRAQKRRGAGPQATGGAYAPSPGIVYPTLTLLEEIGHVEARASEDAKRLYAITPAGRAHLAENRATAEAALARLDQLRRKGEVFDAGPVFRAMTNLKAVLQQRLVDPYDKQLMFSVADLIDEAARKIERL